MKVEEQVGWNIVAKTATKFPKENLHVLLIHGFNCMSIRQGLFSYSRMASSISRLYYVDLMAYQPLTVI